MGNVKCEYTLEYKEVSVPEAIWQLVEDQQFEARNNFYPRP